MKKLNDKEKLESAIEKLEDQLQHMMIGNVKDALELLKTVDKKKLDKQSPSWTQQEVKQGFNY